MPGEGWLYGHVEGQQFVNALSRALADLIREQGGKAEVPRRVGTVSHRIRARRKRAELHQQLVGTPCSLCVRPVPDECAM